MPRPRRARSGRIAANGRIAVETGAAIAAETAGETAGDAAAVGVASTAVAVIEADEVADAARVARTSREWLQ